jgi:hypothetical protein
MSQQMEKGDMTAPRRLRDGCETAAIDKGEGRLEAVSGFQGEGLGWPHRGKERTYVRT